MPHSRLYAHVPIFHQVIWNRCDNPHTGLIHELGFHIQHHLVSQETYSRVQPWIDNRKRHMFPTEGVQNLQCMCINTLHIKFGIRRTSHYRLSPQTHAPFLFFNRYSFHVYYKGSIASDQSISLFEITLLVKYGVDFKAPVVQRCFLSYEPVTDSALLRYSLYHIYTRIQELASRFAECTTFGCSNYALECLCETCQILDALYYFIRKSNRIYQRRLALYRSHILLRSMPFGFLCE